jgi:hypothetical protein
MFYQATELDNLLICKICDRKLDDPRSLPCGESFCNKCIDTISGYEKKQFECQNCNTQHAIPDGGFPINAVLNKILQLKSNEVFRNNLVKDFKDASNLVKIKAEKVESDLQAGEKIIYEHCKNVKDEVQLALEEAHFKLDEFHIEFFNEIDNYERECYFQFENIQSNKRGIEIIIEESKVFYSVSEDLLKNFNFDASEFKVRFAQANILLENLENVQDKLYSDMFQGVLFKFEKNLTKRETTSASIGILKRQKIVMNFFENIENIKELDLSQIFNNANRSFSDFSFKSFLSRKFLCTYRNQNQNLNFVLLDTEANIRNFRNNIIFDPKLIEIIQVLTCTSDNFIYILTNELLSDEEFTVDNLRSFDQNLNIISMLRLSNQENIIDMASFKGDLSILITSQESLPIIRTYNSKFEIILEFSRLNQNLFFPNYLKSLKENDNYFILLAGFEDYDERNLLAQEKFLVINKINGLVVDQFFVHNFNEWIIYLNKYILTQEVINDIPVNSTRTIFRCYKFNGDLIDIKCLFRDTINAKLEFSLNKKLFFLNQETSRIVSF